MEEQCRHAGTRQHSAASRMRDRHRGARRNCPPPGWQWVRALCCRCSSSTAVRYSAPCRSVHAQASSTAHPSGRAPRLCAGAVRERNSCAGAIRVAQWSPRPLWPAAVCDAPVCCLSAHPSVSHCVLVRVMVAGARRVADSFCLCRCVFEPLMARECAATASARAMMTLRVRVANQRSAVCVAQNTADRGAGTVGGTEADHSPAQRRGRCTWKWRAASQSIILKINTFLCMTVLGHM